MLERKEEKVDVLISGMGPAGLATAVEALRAGKTIAIVVDRSKDQFSRLQRVVLEKEARDYLLHMYFTASLKQEPSPEDNQFIKLLDEMKWLPISEIEKFLFRHLHFLAAQNKENLNQANPLTIFERSTLVEVDLDQGVAAIESTATPVSPQNKKIHFGMLVGADGPNHHAVDVVNKGLPKKQQVTYSKDFSKPHQYHVGIQNIACEILDEIPKADREHTQIGVAPDGLYYSIVIDIKAETKVAACHITCEIPANLYNNYYAAKAAVYNAADGDKTPEHLLQNLHTAHAAIFNLIKTRIALIAKPSVKLISTSDAKNHLLFLFLSPLQQASKAAIIHQSKEGDKKVFFLIGDAYRTAYYLAGNNLNTAFKQVQGIPDLFRCHPKKLEKEAEKYNALCQSFSKGIKKQILMASILGKKKSWVHGGGFIDLIYGSYRAYRENPAAHWAAIAGDITTLDKMTLAQLAIQDTKGKNILHKVLEAGSNGFIEWLVSGDSEKQKLFLILLFQDAHAFDKQAHTPITALMESKLSVDEKTQAFKIIVKSAIPIMSLAHPPQDKDQNNLAHLAAKYNMDDSARLLANQAAHLFSLPNAQGQVALMHIALSANAPLFNDILTAIPALNLNVEDKAGNNLGHLALHSAPILSTLIANKTDLFDKCNQQSQTPIEFAFVKLNDISLDPLHVESKNLDGLVDGISLLAQTFPIAAQKAAKSIQVRDDEGSGLGHHLVRFIVDSTDLNFKQRLALLEKLAKSMPSLFELKDKEGRKPDDEFYTRNKPEVGATLRVAMEEKPEKSSEIVLGDIPAKRNSR